MLGRKHLRKASVTRKKVTSSGADPREGFQTPLVKHAVVDRKDSVYHSPRKQTTKKGPPINVLTSSSRKKRPGITKLAQVQPRKHPPSPISHQICCH